MSLLVFLNCFQSISILFSLSLSVITFSTNSLVESLFSLYCRKSFIRRYEDITNIVINTIIIICVTLTFFMTMPPP